MWPGLVGAKEPVLSIVLDTSASGPVISRNIFGQFAEQLGEGIYGGIWVGKDSAIPNIRGIRGDVVAALRALKIPNIRWPGGCFADSYNWRDGIGPADQRPATYNINWGPPLETNEFGTDEFMDLVGQVGSEAYVSVNVGSGTAREAAQWLEYMTSAQPTTLTLQRQANGRQAPYRVKFLGFGNEVWACGGDMTAQTYVEHLRTFAHFVRNLNPAQSGPNRFMPGADPMVGIAVGPGDDNPEYTEAIMKAWSEDSALAKAVQGLSIHHYTMGNKGAMRDPATGFGDSEYVAFVHNAYAMDKLIDENAAIMDKYDPQKRVGLVIDEWGTWLQPMPGTPTLNIKQQNSLRDAIVAAIHLNIFARRADRVRMANIAQMVNVLQSMILTDGNKMLLTPTYHLFKMYVPFQDATLMPLKMEQGEFRSGDTVVPRIDAIAARASDRTILLAITNIDPRQGTSIRLPGIAGHISGETLTAEHIDDINTFENLRAVQPRVLNGHPERDGLVIDVPAKSVSVLRIRAN